MRIVSHQDIHKAFLCALCSNLQRLRAATFGSDVDTTGHGREWRWGDGGSDRYDIQRLFDGYALTGVWGLGLCAPN